MIKVSDYIIRFLEEQGIKHIFLLSGGGAIHLVDSIGKSNIKYICNLHEQAAGIAAEAYSQYSGFGVALVTTGPGSTNIITPIAGAWFDSIPMLILCGQVNTYDRINNRGIRQFGYQEIDMVSLVKSITKYAFTVTNPYTIQHHLKKAIYLAKEGRPGPVVLEIPLDIQSSLIEEQEMIDFALECQCFSEPKLLLKKQIKEVIKDLNIAKKPIILAGNGIRLSNGLNDFYTFIDKTKIPVLTTWKALDFLEEEHPLFVGRPGVYGQRGGNINQQNSDFIICIGARLDHGQIAYKIKNFAPNAKKVIVDIDAAEINKLDIKIDYPIISDAKYFLQELNNQIDTIKIDTSVWLKECKENYLKYPSGHPFDVNKVNIYSFIEILSNLLPENSLIIPGSSGTCSEVTMQHFRIKKGTRVFNTEGLGSMGYGIAAAIGGCLASEKKTICIEGDGSFFMNVQELEVIRRLNLPIKIFVLNNNGYGAIRNTQKSLFNGFLVGSDTTSGITLPNLKATAKSYKIPYYKIEKTSQIKTVLKKVIKNENPIICEIMMDEKHETLPRTIVFKDKNGKFDTMPMQNMKPIL